MSIIEEIQNIHDDDKTLLKKTYEKLIKENDYDLINYYFCAIKNYNYINENMENKISREDDKFKKAIKNKYKNCIITGKGAKICEVAHIYPYAKCSDKEKYDIENGILLCRELHKLFDDHDMKINDNYIITFSDEIMNDESYRDYHKYHNTKLNHNISKKYLNKKYKC